MRCDDVKESGGLKPTLRAYAATQSHYLTRQTTERMTLAFMPAFLEKGLRDGPAAGKQVARVSLGSTRLRHDFPQALSSPIDFAPLVH